MDRRLEEVAKAVGGGYCRLQMPLKLALAARGTVARHRVGALERGGGGGGFPPLPMHPTRPQHNSSHWFFTDKRVVLQQRGG